MSNRSKLNLLPCPRSLKILRGTFTLPRQKPLAAIKVVRTHSAPDHAEGYALTISKNGIEISFRETGGLRAATATLRLPLRAKSFQPHFPSGVLRPIFSTACEPWMRRWRTSLRPRLPMPILTRLPSPLSRCRD